MTELLAEINQLIVLVEAQIPANPNSPANRRLRKRLEKDMAEYFNKLERAFPYSKLESIYNKYVEKE